MIQLDQDDVPPQAAPIDMLEHYFGAHGWAFERLGDEEIAASVEGSWTTYQLRAMWREDDGVLQFIAHLDVRVPDNRRAPVYETLSLVNEQLWLGHFEMWAADGALVYRHATLLAADDEGGLSLDQAETLVEAALDECERYYPVFQFVIWAGKKPSEAIDAAMIDTVGEA